MNTCVALGFLEEIRHVDYVFSWRHPNLYIFVFVVVVISFLGLLNKFDIFQPPYFSPNLWFSNFGHSRPLYIFWIPQDFLNFGTFRHLSFYFHFNQCWLLQIVYQVVFHFLTQIDFFTIFLLLKETFFFQIKM